VSDQRPVCLITGGATGIGAACAEHFARSGWNVAINYYPEASLAEAEALAGVCAERGAQTLTLPADVARDADCRRLLAAVLQRWNRLDGLINSAGTTRFIAHDDLDALDADEFQRVYAVNTIGSFQMARACAPALRASGQGSILNISSIAALVGNGSSIAYAASKGAVNTLTVALARVLAPQVRVNAIAPGFVDAGLPSRVLEAQRYAEVRAQQVASAPLQRYCSAAEVAAMAFTITTAAPAMTGEVVVLDNRPGRRRGG
jgi:3-oxoacyl-[acyl-carrier protein] reductase